MTAHTDPTGVIYDVKSFEIHPNYSKTTTDFDAAVVQIIGKFNFNEYIRPIPLTDVVDRSTVVGKEAMVSGWGRLRAV